MKCEFPKSLKLTFSAYQIHPAIPRCLLASRWELLLRLKRQKTANKAIFMPTHIDEIRVHGRPGPHLWSHAQLQEREPDAIKGDVRLLDEAGQVAVEISGLRFESLEGDTQRASKLQKSQSIARICKRISDDLAL